MLNYDKERIQELKSFGMLYCYEEILLHISRRTRSCNEKRCAPRIGSVITRAPRIKTQGQKIEIEMKASRRERIPSCKRLADEQTKKIRMNKVGADLQHKGR
jgi:hypothetical protein